MKFLFQLDGFFVVVQKEASWNGYISHTKKNGKRGKIIDSNILWRYSLVPILLLYLYLLVFSLIVLKNNTFKPYLQRRGSWRFPKGQLEIPPVDGLINCTDAGRCRCRKRQSERRCFGDVFFKPEDLSIVVASKIRGIDGSCFSIFRVLLRVVATIQSFPYRTWVSANWMSFKIKG